MTWVGKSIVRPEDRSLVDGTVRFSADVEPVGGIAHAAFVRSPLPHARIVTIDAAEARAMAGVHAVIDASVISDFTRPIPNVISRQVVMPLLANEAVNYVGEPIALVVAASPELASDAARAVDVELAAEEPVVDLHAALSDTAPPLHGLDDHVVHERSFGFGASIPDGSTSVSPTSISHQAVMHRSNALPLELFDITAVHEPGPDRYTVWANYGGPLALQAVMASCLGVSPDRLRLVVPDRIGGNFGVKQAMYPAIVLVAAAARVTGRPVRWTESRPESLIAGTAGSERLTSVEGGFGGEGRLERLRIQQVENFGAYVRTPEPAGLYRMHGAISGPYLVDAVEVHNRGLLTNQVPSGLNRGFGAPQLFLSLESMMDKAARFLSLDRAEIRRRNLVRSFPHACPSGAVLDSGDYVAVLDRACELIGWSEAGDASRTTAVPGRRRGLGLACSVETSGNNLGYMNLAADPDSPMAAVARSGAGAVATVSIGPSGNVSVHVDSPDCGQGYRVVVAQIVADELGLTPDDIAVDTALDTRAGEWLLTSGNYANRFSTAVASAVALAARSAAAKLRLVAADELGVPPDQVSLGEGVATARGIDRSLPILRLGARLHWDLAGRPDGVEGPIHERAVYAPGNLRAPESDGALETSFTYSFQCDAAVIEVDDATGVVSVEHYVSVHDAGTVLHPSQFESQILGGLAHGLGAATAESIEYGADGQPLARTLLGYGAIRSTAMPRVTLDRVETPSPHTVHGAKGIGDGCAVLVPAVLASAVADALGLEENPTPPFTPARVWELCRSTQGTT